MHRCAKIVATFGPASSSPSAVKRLLKAGVDVVRLNLSHGTADEHSRLIATVREQAADLGREVPILLDLMGPRYRLGHLEERRTLAAKAFHHVSVYDTAVASYLTSSPSGSSDLPCPDSLPDVLILPLTKVSTLRYGENPHQLGGCMSRKVRHMEESRALVNCTGGSFRSIT